MEATQRLDERLNGWLLFFGALLILNPIRIAFVLVTVSIPAYTLIPVWFSTFEMLMNLLFLLYAIVVPFYFFHRKKAAPVMVIALFLFNMFFVAINGTITQWIPEQARHGAGEFRMREFVAGGILFLIATVYLMTSQRVKTTFVK
jgi:hypothetical protein